MNEDEGPIKRLFQMLLLGAFFVLIFGALPYFLDKFDRFAGSRLFDETALEHHEKAFPDLAKRCFYSEVGQGKNGTWAAFTAPRSLTKVFLEDRFDLEMGDFEPFPEEKLGAVTKSPLQPPPWSDEQLKGYWDLGERPVGRYFRGENSRRGYFRIFINAEGRVFYTHKPKR